MVRRSVSSLLGRLPAGVIGDALAATAVGRNPHMFASRLDTVRTALWPGSLSEIYRTQVSLWRDPRLVLAFEPQPLDDAISLLARGHIPGSRLEQMALVDSLSYLPDDILVKLDRAAMAVSLESRVPFLDHRIVEFAWSLPPNLKMRDGVQKWVLRRVLARYVPDELVERPKQGFGAPIGEWLRGSLRAWAEDMLNEPGLRSDGYLRSDVVGQLWAQHLAGRHNWQSRLWPLIVFQQWLRAND
jgi:asparagine synthase (glutamine-hydrolysing)